MKETDKVLSEVLQKALSAAEKTGQFAIDQAPDLIKQLLIWKAVQNGLQLLIGVLLFYVAYRVFAWTNNQIATDDRDRGSYYISNSWGDYIGSIVSIIFLTMIGSLSFLSGLFPLVQILVAPKIYLIEYAASLIK